MRLGILEPQKSSWNSFSSNWEKQSKRMRSWR